MTEDEVQVVWSLVVLSLTREAEWGQAMRYARLFTPGTVVRGLNKRPAYARRNAYEHAAVSGLLYAEGVAFHHGFAHERMGWCVDGDGMVVEPTFPQPGTAYFGVVLRPEYMRRAFEACRDDDGRAGFRGVYGGWSCPPPDPVADIVHGLGRDIPASIRDWSPTADIRSGGPQEPPAWVLEELQRWDGSVS